MCERTENCMCSVGKRDVTCMHGRRARDESEKLRSLAQDKRIFVRKIQCKLWRYVNFNLWKNTFLCLFADGGHEYAGGIHYVSSPRWNNPIFVKPTFDISQHHDIFTIKPYYITVILKYKRINYATHTPIDKKSGTCLNTRKNRNTVSFSGRRASFRADDALVLTRPRFNPSSAHIRKTHVHYTHTVPGPVPPLSRGSSSPGPKSRLGPSIKCRVTALREVHCVLFIVTTPYSHYASGRVQMAFRGPRRLYLRVFLLMWVRVLKRSIWIAVDLLMAFVSFPGEGRYRGLGGLSAGCVKSSF